MWAAVGPIRPTLPSLDSSAKTSGGRSEQKALSFKELLQEAFDSANRAQWDAERAAELLATGQIEDIHQVTILTEKANLSLQLMISIRNKVIDAYQEISRMQV